jgi:hypothetical protein
MCHPDPWIYVYENVILADKYWWNWVIVEVYRERKI